MEKLNINISKILNATIELMGTKQYDSITIKDICTTADISRQTFYNHFKNKDEIFKFFFSNIAVRDKLFSEDIPPEYLFSENYIFDIINFFDKYSDILYALKHQNILWYLGKDMISRHKKVIFSNIKDKYLQEKLDYYYLFIAPPTAYICLEWIKNGKKESKEDIVHMLKTFRHFRANV